MNFGYTNGQIPWRKIHITKIAHSRVVWTIRSTVLKCMGATFFRLRKLGAFPPKFRMPSSSPLPLSSSFPIPLHRSASSLLHPFSRKSSLTYLSTSVVISLCKNAYWDKTSFVSIPTISITAPQFTKRPRTHPKIFKE